MIKSKFVKEFQMSRRLQRVMMRVEGETDNEYEYRTRIARYGIEGEDRVYFQLEGVELPLVCLSDVRVECDNDSAQADFVVISKDTIYLVEVKNLFGNIRITDECEAVRLLPRAYTTEEEGMENPFTQVAQQARVFERLLERNGFYIKFDTLIVMANPKTAIFGNANVPLIKYDKIKSYFEERIDRNCSDQEYKKMLEVGEFIKFCNKERYFNDFPTMKRKFEKSSVTLKPMNEDDMALYEDLLEFRRKLSKEFNWPLCNIFLNRDAENLVKVKPETKEEFMRIPGLKERKYNLFGEAVLKIIRKYRN